MTLDDALDEIMVEPLFDPLTAEQVNGLQYVVTDRDGIVAYFLHEPDACRFRLDLVNRRLNP